MMQPLADFLRSRASLLWWFHSTYALLFGLLVMWLGVRHFAYLRLIIFNISFIWLSSLFLPALVDRPWLAPEWRERVRLVINYFNKNFYQQLLFFLLPIYYTSMTMGSRNMWFLLLLGLSAILSTMDIVYDRYLSARWQLTALFFMFNLFCSINVMLPVLWSVSNHIALWASGALAFVGFASMLYKLSGLRGRPAKQLLCGAALCMLILLTLFRPYIPPAPIRLASAEFGRSVRSLQIVNRLEKIPSDPGNIVVLTAIKAPMGLEERVRHRWYLDGRTLHVSSFYAVTGGREEGYRIWTQVTWREGVKGRLLSVDVETQGGQLIGRARLKG